ncbi:chorismate mutase [Pseudomonas sp. AMR01]|uniref:chorismate mutase n=1 Tax=Pseudomonas sp. AMR01 TaxID=3064904 RepID=UPI0035C1DC7D
MVSHLREQARSYRRLTLKHQLLFALLFATVSANAVAAPPPTLAPLLDSIVERLSIADQVALSKWDSHKPVEDRPRELDVIASVKAQAPSYNLAPEVAEQFFAAQMEANKMVQYSRLSDWHLKGKAPDTPRPDLVGKIRPQLDELQKRLLQQLADFSPDRSNPQCPLWVAMAVHEARHDPLIQIAMARATGELCIYQP